MVKEFSDAMKHVLNNIFDDEDQDGPVAKALKDADVYDVDVLLLMQEQHVQQLGYMDGENRVKLSLSATMKLLGVIEWGVSDQSITRFDWERIDMDSILRRHRTRIIGASPVATSPPRTPRTPVASTPVATSANDYTLEFKKGIKCSISHYKHFKNDNKWIIWKNHLLSMTDTHDVSEVLDKDYTPITAPDKALFKEKQKFVFSVFREHLQTGKTKKIVHENKSDGDAQKTYQQLLELFESGTTKKLEEERLEKLLREFKLTTQWSDPIETFLTRWSH